jgi:transcriptional regulator with XRE-family HTH domain
VSAQTEVGGTPWPESVTKIVIAQVERYRKEQGLRGEDLAERCMELGFKIDKSMLSKLATGSRKTLGVAELLVLAAALGVPPIALLLPMNQSESVALLPDGVMKIDVALAWLDGLRDGPPGTQKGGKPMIETREAVQLLRIHWRLASILRDAKISLAHDRLFEASGESKAASALRESGKESVLRSEKALIEHRKMMRDKGWTILPPLSSDIACIEEDPNA